MSTSKIQQLDLASKIQKIDFESLSELRNLVDRIALTVRLTDQVTTQEVNVPDDYVRSILVSAFIECIGDIEKIQKILSDVEGCNSESQFKQSLYDMNVVNEKQGIGLEFKEIEV